MSETVSCANEQNRRMKLNEPLWVGSATPIALGVF